MTYDSRGNMLTETNALGHTTGYTYDPTIMPTTTYPNFVMAGTTPGIWGEITWGVYFPWLTLWVTQPPTGMMPLVESSL
jgi:hypothetical protein